MKPKVSACTGQCIVLVKVKFSLTKTICVMKGDLTIKKYPVALYGLNIWASNQGKDTSFITTCGAISTLMKPKNK